MIKKLLKKYFESLAYFYSHLQYRIFIVFALSLVIGILDGFGLTMFLPLLQLVNDPTSVNPESLGKLSFLLDAINSLGVSLNLLTILLIMAAFFFAKGIVQYMSGVYKVNVQQRFITRLRLKNLNGLHRLSYKYFVMADVGRIQNTMTGEVERVARSFLSYFTAFQYVVMVIVYMAFAFSFDAQFAILVSIGGVVTNFSYKKLYKNTKGASRKLTGDSNIFQSLVIQNVSNFKYLKATGSLRRYGNKLVESIRKIEKSNKKIGKLDAILTAAREPILITVVVGVMYIQTTFLGSDLGAILISLIFFYRALNYLMQMQVHWNKFLAVSGSLENMTKFERELNRNKDISGKFELKKEIEKLELMDVSFYYDNIRILNKINLCFRKQETVAFVGESGSGKTTLVNIIAGLLPTEHGNYLINGIDSQSFNLNSLQNRIGYITQDSVIFNDTLFNNVTFWAEKNKANLRRFSEAIRKAAINEFVQNLPNKEEEILGNNGINLSGGQKQRISIARELYKNVEFLILDEATSALDSETERAIQENIDDLKGEYTILIIAHRISTIKNADKIVVMKNGKISSIGGFNELLEKSEYFKKLVDLQEV